MRFFPILLNVLPKTRSLRLLNGSFGTLRRTRRTTSVFTESSSSAVQAKMDTSCAVRLTGVLLPLFAFTGIHLQKAFSQETLEEYCDTESFRANCSESEVILLETARYGRMNIGRCVETPMGYIGCYRDVLLLADRRCSGKRLCEIHIPNAEFESTRPCLRELKSYLEISYICIPVANLTASYCQRNNELPVYSATSGFLASVITSDTPHCAGLPWVIRVERGQRVNLTVYDFTIDIKAISFTGSRKLDDADQGSCREYALIEDGDRKFPICGGTGSERVGETYMSSGSVVRIWMTAGVAPTDHHRFLIHYVVSGCADPVLPETTWFRRSVDGNAVAGCKRSELTWIMECHNYVWTWSPTDHNCSSVQIEERRLRAEPEKDYHSDNMAVAIVLLTAAMVGLLVIMSAIVLISRGRKRRRKTIRDLIGRRRDRLAATTTTTATDIPSLSLSVGANNKKEKATNDVMIVSPATEFLSPLVFFRDAEPESIEAIEAVC